MAGFWKPTVIERGNDGQDIIINNPNKNLPITQQRKNLPIWQHRHQILYAMENFRTLVLVGETGCGKTTQIPQYL